MQTNLMSMLGFESDSDVDSSEHDISFKTTSAIKKNHKSMATPKSQTGRNTENMLTSNLKSACKVSSSKPKVINQPPARLGVGFGLEFTPKRSKLDPNSFKLLKEKYKNRMEGNNDENFNPSAKGASNVESFLNAARMVKTPKPVKYSIFKGNYELNSESPVGDVVLREKHLFLGNDSNKADSEGQEHKLKLRHQQSKHSTPVPAEKSQQSEHSTPALSGVVRSPPKSQHTQEKKLAIRHSQRSSSTPVRSSGRKMSSTPAQRLDPSPGSYVKGKAPSSSQQSDAPRGKQTKSIISQSSCVDGEMSKKVNRKIDGVRSSAVRFASPKYSTTPVYGHAVDNSSPAISVTPLSKEYAGRTPMHHGADRSPETSPEDSSIKEMPIKVQDIPLNRVNVRVPIPNDVAALSSAGTTPDSDSPGILDTPVKTHAYDTVDRIVSSSNRNNSMENSPCVNTPSPAVQAEYSYCALMSDQSGVETSVRHNNSPSTTVRNKVNMSFSVDNREESSQLSNNWSSPTPAPLAPSPPSPVVLPVATLSQEILNTADIYKYASADKTNESLVHSVEPLYLSSNTGVSCNIPQLRPATGRSTGKRFNVENVKPVESSIAPSINLDNLSATATKMLLSRQTRNSINVPTTVNQNSATVPSSQPYVQHNTWLYDHNNAASIAFDRSNYEIEAASCSSVNETESFESRDSTAVYSTSDVTTDSDFVYDLTQRNQLVLDGYDNMGVDRNSPESVVSSVASEQIRPEKDSVCTSTLEETNDDARWESYFNADDLMHDGDEDALQIDQPLVDLLKKYNSIKTPSRVPIKTPKSKQYAEQENKAWSPSNMLGTHMEDSTSANISDEESNSIADVTLNTTLTLDDSKILDGDSVTASKLMLDIKKKKRSTKTNNMKELLLVSSGIGECTTIKLHFGNKQTKNRGSRSHDVDDNLVIESRAVEVRMDKYNSTCDHSIVQSSMETTKQSFQSSPHKLVIEKGKEAVLYVSFIPSEFGIYTGALKLKTNKKSYVMLLRGECKHPEPVRRVINTSYVSDCDSGNESVTSLPLDKLISSQTVNEAKPELAVSVSEKKAVSSAEYPVMDTDTHPITAAAHGTDASGSSSSDVSPLGKVEPYQLKEKWLQQWLAQAMCNNPAGEISKPTTMSSSDVELPSPSASPEAGYKLHTSTASISVIPQTLLLYSYDNEIMHNIKHQLDERSSHVDQTNSNATSPHTSTQLLKDKVFESKFVVRNFGNHAVDVQLKASCDAIQIVRMSTTKMKRDAFAFETSINPHCDICVYIEYTTNIHAMQTQLEGLLDPQTDLNALHKKPNSSTAMVQSSVGLMNNYRNSHVGYILLTATSIPDSSATNEPCVNVSSDFVIEVKYHHQYLYQLKLMRQGTRHSSGNKLKGAKQSVHRTIKSVDADVKVAAETAKNVETVESTDIRKSVEIPLSELLSSRKPQKANKTVQKVGDAKDKYTVSTQSTQNAATPTAHDPAKGLVYFKDESIVFDAVACGSVGRKTIDMCNNTDGDIIITFDRPQLPFGILHSIIRLHAKSYVQIPVLYTPQPEDATSHEVSLMGTITDVRSREHFDILKCKISIKLCGSSKT